MSWRDSIIIVCTISRHRTSIRSDRSRRRSLDAPFVVITGLGDPGHRVRKRYLIFSIRRALGRRRVDAFRAPTIKPADHTCLREWFLMLAVGRSIAPADQTRLRWTAGAAHSVTPIYAMGDSAGSPSIRRAEPLRAGRAARPIRIATRVSALPPRRRPRRCLVEWVRPRPLVPCLGLWDCRS